MEPRELQAREDASGRGRGREGTSPVEAGGGGKLKGELLRMGGKEALLAMISRGTGKAGGDLRISSSVVLTETSEVKLQLNGGRDPDLFGGFRRKASDG